MPSHHTPVDPPTTATATTADDRDTETLSSSIELHPKCMTNYDGSLKQEPEDRNQSPTNAISRDEDVSITLATPTKMDESDSNTSTTASLTPHLTVTQPLQAHATHDEIEKPSDVPEVCVSVADGGGMTMTTYVVVPPDGGWGWVVVMASFLCNIVVDGIIFTFGNFIDSLQEEFQATKAEVTIVGSLLSGFYLMAGPFVSALANRYGFRLVTIVGAILACTAFAISSVASSINFLFLSYGVVGGIGFGLIYVPSVITVGFYFERWRAIATGIAVCGSGIGTFLMPPIWKALITAIGWRGTLLIQAGIILHCAIFGALFRPLKPSKVTVPYDPANAEKDEVPAENGGPEKLPLLLRIKQARDEQRTASMTSLHERNYPTASQVQHFSTRVLKSSCLSLNVTVSPAQSPPVTKRVANGSALDATHSEKRLSAPPRVALIFPQIGNSPPASPEMSKLLPNNHCDSRRGSSGGRRVRTRSESLGRCGLPTGIPPTAMNGTARSRASTTTNRGEKSTSGARPMYRDDIFFGASLQRLPQYASQTSALDYTMSVTRLPTRSDLAEEKQSRCKLCPEAVKRTLSTMLDMSLLRSLTFLLLAASGFMTMMGFFVPFMYMTDRAVQGQMDENTAVWLVSAIGIANTIGRVVCGLVTSMPKVNALLINNVSLTLGGLGTMISGLSLSAGYQFTYSCVFGIAAACFASLRSILIVELMGLDKLTNAFGLLCLFQGVAAAIGAPLAGSLLNEQTKDYNPSFYLSGTLILISAIMCYPLNWLNNWERRRKEETEKRDAASKVV